MAFMEISINPVGTGNPSISSFIAAACQLVEEQGLQYQVTPTSTVVEGDIDRLFSLARRMHDIPLSAGAERVVTNIIFDQRTDKEESFAQAVQAVTNPENGVR